MHSSPELDPEDEMFPDEAGGPSTPRNHRSAFNLDQQSELSPPNSQGPSQLASRDDDFSAALSGSPTALNENGKRVHASGIPTSAGSGSGGKETIQVDAETGYTWSNPEEQPGWEWKNNRAREDEARALDSIIDKGSMIKSMQYLLVDHERYLTHTARYGDPLDSTLQVKRR